MTAPRLSRTGRRLLELLGNGGSRTEAWIVAAYPAHPGIVVRNRSGLVRSLRLLQRAGYVVREAIGVWCSTEAGRARVQGGGRTCAVCGRGGVGGWTLGYRPAPRDREAVFAHPGKCAQEAVRQGLVSMPGDRKPQEPTS